MKINYEHFGKHELIHTDKHGEIIHFTFSGESSLDTMLEKFTYYLKAVGFHFNGDLDVVGEE
jgi:hypothetical protein